MWKPMANKMLSNANPLFDHLMARIKEHEKKYINHIGFAYASFEDSISCQDCYTEWYDEFFGLTPEETAKEEYDFYCEASGRLIMYPVMEVYKSQLKTNVYARDILKIWDMGNDVPDTEVLESDHRENFKQEIKTMIDEWERR